MNIFVLDTGVRLSHTDFADREGISKDFVNNDDDAADGKDGWMDEWILAIASDLACVSSLLFDADNQIG